MYEIGKVSYVSEKEFLEIVSTVNVVNNKSLHCDFCKTRYAKSYRDNRKACSIKSKKPVFEYKDRVKYFKCPANFVNMSVVHFIGINRHLRNGVMPFDGPLMEQPNKLIEILDLIESLLNELEKEEIQRQDKKWQTTKSKSL